MYNAKADVRTTWNTVSSAPAPDCCNMPLSMLSVLAAGYHGGRALARRYYEAAKKYLDSNQIAQIHAQLGF